jgi:hypothetical protein
MRFKMILPILLFSGTATFVMLGAPAIRADIIPIEIPSGPELQRLIATCDLLRIKHPQWNNRDCGKYFLVLGARITYEQYSKRIAWIIMNNKTSSDIADFDQDLPLPTSAPTAAPTPTP